MTMQDPIADMLTRIRNAYHAQHKSVVIPSSKIKKEIARILDEENYISGWKAVKDGVKETLKIYLRYTPDEQPLIRGIERISKPSLRVYFDSQHIPEVQNRIGIAILSTSKGVMTDRDARKEKIGGEYIAKVW